MPPISATFPRACCDHLRGCDVLVMESNHDVEMLRVGPYPWSVKQRVMSRVGHLSNDALAEFFASDYDGAAAYVVLAHLSEQNNHPEIARGAAEKALGPRQTLLHNRVLLAAQANPCNQSGCSLCIIMSQCIDPIVGKILAGWRYDISGLAPEMRGDYEQHFAACEMCRSRQRLHRIIDFP